jgi:pyridoxal phosphate enzyme (YggS family)
LIADKLAEVKSNIVEAARACGRDPAEIRLIAVSKTVESELIAEACDCGQYLFGENRVQEALEKIDLLKGKEIHWHLIGHLQKNKVKYIIGQFDLVHSIDSFSLAETVHKKSQEQRTVTKILMQVNISGEESKFGLPPDQLQDTLVRVSQLSGVKVKGLMTIPPMQSDPEVSRKYYAQLRKLRDEMARQSIENIQLDELSMGMSNDYRVAVQEGATLVRVGTAIFGDRS